MVIVVVGFLFLIGHKSVHTEIVIPAPADKVWSVLTDTKKYGEWNRVMVPLEGELKEGETLKYEFYQQPDSSYQIPSMVKQMVENKLLNQGGGTVGILTFDHRYILEPEGDNTKVTIHEEYRGIAVPFWNPEPVEAAYQRLNQSLKERVIEVYQP